MTKIEAIAERSAENLKGLFLDMTEDIEAAILAATTQAEEDEKDSIKLTLSHSIVLDLADQPPTIWKIRALAGRAPGSCAEWVKAEAPVDSDQE